ncbi:MAG: type II secretion system protein GspG [Gammaproteobacteria bacterium]|nr:type II secretion system protein GspG [Gammaproteobacteria bacterium]
METLILIIGISLAMCGQAWLIYIAYRQSIGWAIACFIPLVAIIFAVLNWEKCKLSLSLQCLGLFVTYSIISSNPFDLIGGEIADIRKETMVVAEATRRFNKEANKVPANSLDLLNAGMLDEENTYDPWGLPYNIVNFQGTMSIWSYGEDKLKGGDDNISFGYHW